MKSNHEKERVKSFSKKYLTDTASSFGDAVSPTERDGLHYSTA